MEEPVKEKLLHRVRKEVENCKRCELHKKRKKVVFGDGNPYSQLLIIGEAPGKEEDENGIPFVGRAGKLLRKLLREAGLKEFYITNVVKCRPPNNRTPLKKEIEACLPFLEKQIAILKPKIILVLGNTALKALTGESHKLTDVRGRMLETSQKLIYPSFHPSFALRNKKAKESLAEEIKSLVNYLTK
jgi:uracil-DNA glycosylase family 4